MAQGKSLRIARSVRMVFRLLRCCSVDNVLRREHDGIVGWTVATNALPISTQAQGVVYIAQPALTHNTELLRHRICLRASLLEEIFRCLNEEARRRALYWK